MYIIRASPLAVIPPAHGEGIFSYYSKDDLASGDIVHITVGRIKTLGVVRDSTPLAKNKLALKSSRYALKRVGSVFAKSTGLEKLIPVTDALASSFFVQSGAVIKLLLPAPLLEKPDLTFPLTFPKYGSGHTKILLIGRESDRIEHFTTLTQKTGTLVILVPSAGSLERVHAQLSGAMALSPSLGKRALRDAVTLLRGSPPKILITTPAFLAFLPENTHTLVLDDAFSPHLAREESPRIHIRALVDALAKLHKLPLILTSSHWTPDALAYEKNATLLAAPSAIAIVNMNKEQLGEKDYLLLSRHTRERVNKAKRSILVVNRKGYAPLIICNDCGSTIACDNCESPITVHGNTHHPTYACHHCGKVKTLTPACRSCKSTSFKWYGVGVERMAEVARLEFPSHTIVTLDGSASRTSQTASVRDFLAAPKSILVSTEVVFEHSVTQVDAGVIASIDHVFTLPEYRTEEHAARLIMRLGDIAKTTLVQTRLPERPLWKELDTANRTLALARRLLGERSRAHLPPAIILIQCTVKDRSNIACKEKSAQLAQALTRLRIPAHASPAFIAKEKGFYVWHVTLQLPLKSWNDTNHPIRSLLASLGYAWSVAVNPKSTL